MMRDEFYRQSAVLCFILMLVNVAIGEFKSAAMFGLTAIAAGIELQAGLPSA